MSRRSQALRDLQQDVEDHIALETQDNIDRGMPPEEAREAAIRKFGNVALIMEDTRAVWSPAWLPQFLQDLRYGARLLRRSPGFTLLTVLTLALGIGANAALFSVVNALLLRNLPYPDSDKLMYVTEFWPHELPVRGPPSPDFDNWRAQGRLFDRLEAYGGGGALNLTGAGEPERVQGTMVTAGFLSLIGVHPALGRNFTPEEDRPDGPPAVILGNGLWARRFSSTRDIIGKIVQLDGRDCTIVGVLPASFVFPDNNYSADLLVPMALPTNRHWQDQKSFRLLRVLARVKPGVKPDALRAEFASILRNTAAEEPAQFVTMRKDMEVRVIPLHEWLSGDIRAFLLILQSAVMMVLLIGCLNIANLQIARSIARQKEMALRLSLGAGQARLTRQLLTESLLLSSMGGVAGLALGNWGIRYVRTVLPQNLHLLETVHMDYAVLAFTFSVVVVIGILTGLAPALTTIKVGLNESMKRGEGRGTAGGHHRLRGTLVIAEVALAMVLVVASGLLIRSFMHLATVDLGFDPQGVLTLRVPLSGQKYNTPESQAAFAAALIEHAQAIPGVREAAIAGGLPLVGTIGTAGMVIEGQPPPPPGGAPTVPLTSVSKAYFHALGIPMVRGRAFTDGDREGAALVIMVNQSFAARFFPGGDAIGKHVKFGSVRPGPMYEIVGVTGNVRQQGLLTANSPEVYVPYRQHGYEDPELLLILKSEPFQAGLVADATGAIHSIDPNMPVYDVATMEERIGDALTEQRARMVSMGIFAALALTLAAVGIFGVMAYFVSRSAHEIGIRMALGAEPKDVLKQVLGHGMFLTGLGIALGLAGALMMTRVLGKMLYGVGVSDPLTLAGAVALFAVVAMAACCVPAYWAARVDPIVTLRHD